MLKFLKTFENLKILKPLKFSNFFELFFLKKNQHRNSSFTHLQIQQHWCVHQNEMIEATQNYDNLSHHVSLYAPQQVVPNHDH